MSDDSPSPAEREYSASIWQDGLEVASVTAADPDTVRREAMHYAMVYAQDGAVIITSPQYDELFGTTPEEDAG